MDHAEQDLAKKEAVISRLVVDKANYLKGWTGCYQWGYYYKRVLRAVTPLWDYTTDQWNIKNRLLSQARTMNSWLSDGVQRAFAIHCSYFGETNVDQVIDTDTGMTLAHYLDLIYLNAEYFSELGGTRVGIEFDRWSFWDSSPPHPARAGLSQLLSLGSIDQTYFGGTTIGRGTERMFRTFSQRLDSLFKYVSNADDYLSVIPKTVSRRTFKPPPFPLPRPPPSRLELVTLGEPHYIRGIRLGRRNSS